MKRSEAIKYRKAIESSAIFQSDEVALKEKWMFSIWEVGKAYSISDRVRYNDKLYKCVQSHTAQSDWMPNITPALWTEVSIEEYPEWVQPIGASDAYSIGAKVSYNGEHWVSNCDNNVWKPSVFGWDLIN